MNTKTIELVKWFFDRIISKVESYELSGLDDLVRNFVYQLQYETPVELHSSHVETDQLYQNKEEAIYNHDFYEIRASPMHFEVHFSNDLDFCQFSGRLEGHKDADFSIHLVNEMMTKAETLKYLKQLGHLPRCRTIPRNRYQSLRAIPRRQPSLFYLNTP